jgi:hypothetical protein
MPALRFHWSVPSSVLVLDDAVDDVLHERFVERGAVAAVGAGGELDLLGGVELDVAVEGNAVCGVARIPVGIRLRVERGGEERLAKGL